MGRDIITLTDRDVSYNIFLPDQQTDYIQKKIAETRTPYELDMLRDMSNRLKPGEVMLDIGANIGNHSIYLVAVSGCNVIAYEPNRHLAAGIAHSVEINGFGRKLIVHAKGVGADSGRAHFAAERPDNLGGQRLTQGRGSIPVIALDKQKLTSPIRMMKIDVEGMEIEVLQGARQLIDRDRPLLYIESATESEFRTILSFLEDRNYLLWDTFNATPTHLFLPSEIAAPNRHLHHMKTRQTLEGYRNTGDLRRLKEELNNANLKYRDVSQKLTDVSAELEEARRKYRNVSYQLANAKAAEREVEVLREEVAALENRLNALWQNTKKVSEWDGRGEMTPEFVAGWARALPLSDIDVARRWFSLFLQLRTRFPRQALALLRAVHALAPDVRTSRALAILLIESGDSRQAIEILRPLARDINLSSREARLLALAEAEYDGRELRDRATRVVRTRLRVATIMDEFTATGFWPECDLQQLSLGKWQEELEDFRPELLLIESAWRGLNEEWKTKIGMLSSELQGVIAWCRKHSVPTAFWNKEDPVHFETFRTTAQKFDIVFTTDVDSIPRYKSELGHSRVYLLPFACQPEIHNPIETCPRKDAFCFAGAYYSRYPDRARDLDEFLTNLSQYRPFEIFDRNLGKDHQDYMFPDVYAKYIVGTLPPSKIDHAYKGYTFGVNMNSVKNSQSMYARRVYELLASNTFVVSNYSVGLRLMFGDLVISTDSGKEALQRISDRERAGIGARLRLAGLRKVLSQHTYSHRLAQIARCAGLVCADGSVLPEITVVAMATTRDEAECLIAQVNRQALDRVRLVLMMPETIDLPETDLPRSLRRLSHKQAAQVRLGDLVGPDEWIGGFTAGDHYGPNYLTDLVLATRYSEASVLGKASYHRLTDGYVEVIDGPKYAEVSTLAARRALLRGDRMPAVRLDRWLLALPRANLEGGDMLSLDPYSYCEAGTCKCDGTEQVAAVVDDPPGIDSGISQADLAVYAERMAPAINNEIAAPLIAGARIGEDMVEPRSGKVNWTTDETESWFLTSTLGDDEHVYIYEKKSRPLSELRDEDGSYRLHPLVRPGLNIVFVALWLDDQMQRIGHQMLAAARNNLLNPPESAEYVRFGLRLRGPGACEVRGFVLGDHYRAPHPVISSSRILLLTNNYPSYRDLYRNGFVYSRIRAYRELGGVTPDVYRLRPEKDLSWDEFHNIDYMTGSAEQLDFLLESGQYDHVLVHFLNEDMWRVIARHIDRIRVTVWIHGAEIQPWWRRTFNYFTDEDLENAKVASDARLTFWRSLFSPLPKNLHFVFVSQHFADEVFEDLAISCPPNQYSVIHNPIDDHVFAFQEKPIEQRGKILSIRSFASPKYANDLTVKAIISLKRRKFFKDLEFLIIGDGPMFEEITAPLAEIPNVTCQKRFLTQAEIAEVQRDYGVFLNPTRWDSQGVSRDEAMSAGLVPITNQVAAIPEFMDENCGYLAEPEDAKGLADAIADMWKNPDTFLRKSRAAAERVRAQRPMAKVIAAELALFTR